MALKDTLIANIPHLLFKRPKKAERDGHLSRPSHRALYLFIFFVIYNFFRNARVRDTLFDIRRFGGRAFTFAAMMTCTEEERREVSSLMQEVRKHLLNFNKTKRNSKRIINDLIHFVSSFRCTI